MPRVIKDTLLQGKYNAGYIVAFSLLFAFLGSFVPAIYYRYLDNTQYIEIQQPARMSKTELKPCEEYNFRFYRNALITTIGTNAHSEIRRAENGSIERVSTRDIPDIVLQQTNGFQLVESTSRPLPCDIEQGEYFIVVFFKYTFKGNKKPYSFVTEKFTVIK